MSIEEQIREQIRLRPEELEPYTPAWRASDQCLSSIESLLVWHKPDAILETGPGASSILFLRYAVAAINLLGKQVAHCAIDHAPNEFHDIHVEHLKSLGLSTVTTLGIPMADDYYDVQQLPDWVHEQTFDFVFLDGPPNSGHRASVSAFEFVTKRLATKPVVIQDDTNRQLEKTFLETHIRKYLGDGSHVLHGVQDRRFQGRWTSFLVPTGSPGAIFPES